MGIKPVHATVTVTTHATRVQCTATAGYATSVYFEAAKANSGNIFVGLVTVSSTVYITCLAAGEGFMLSVDGKVAPGSTHGGNEFQLTSFYVDSASDGDKCQFTYLERVGAT